MISLKPAHLSRYASIAKLLLKYGRGDVVRQAGLEAVVDDDGVTTTHHAGPESLARDLEDLGPTFIKLGQLLSTRADLLPPAYLEALTRLEDGVDPLPFEIIQQTVEEQLGVRLSKAFDSFETEAFACASIGQVHRAVLRDGRKVAVKVQRPDLRQRVIDDLDAMHELAVILDARTQFGRRARFEQLLESLREVMTRELDYRQEAENSHNLRKNLAAFPTIYVPRVIDDYTAERVITLEFIDGVKITEVSPMVLVELDRTRLADDLFRAYLHQVLVDGLFHADPHPGNLMLMPDKRIALLDFGMVARVTPEMQRRLVKLLLAVADGRGEEAAEESVALGRHYERERFHEDDFRERIATLVAANQGKPMAQMQIGRVMLEINAAAGETGLKLPNSVVMLGKTLFNLDKVVTVLDPTFNPSESVRRRTGEILQQYGRSHWSMSRLYQTLLETGDFVERLPERLNKVADLVAQNKLRVEVDAIDEIKLIAGMQKIANRITAGLILAAMIIGASLMMHLKVTLTVFGYPLIAMLFFLGAATASCILLYRIFTCDERDD